MRYLCTVSYIGVSYSGFQRQKDKKTLQQVIEKSLSKLYRETITIHPASRTDAGVHADKMCFHFDVENAKIPRVKVIEALNNKLPYDIKIIDIIEVSDNFHARYSVSRKKYRYDFYHLDFEDLRKSFFSLYIKKPIDIESANNFLKIFSGKKDWKALMSSGSPKHHTIRTIYDCYITKTGDSNYSLYIEADGFLYHMVRNIVASLIEYLDGNLSIEECNMSINNKKRTTFSHIAPARALTLVDIQYDQF